MFEATPERHDAGAPASKGGQFRATEKTEADGRLTDGIQPRLQFTKTVPAGVSRDAAENRLNDPRTSVVSDRLFRGTDRWTVQTTLTLPSVFEGNMHTPEQTVRATLNRFSMDNDTFSTVELFHNGRWNEIDRIPAAGLAGAPERGCSDDDEIKEFARVHLDDQLIEALRIIG